MRIRQENHKLTEENKKHLAKLGYTQKDIIKDIEGIKSTLYAPLYKDDTNHNYLHIFVTNSIYAITQIKETITNTPFEKFAINVFYKEHETNEVASVIGELMGKLHWKYFSIETNILIDLTPIWKALQNINQESLFLNLPNFDNHYRRSCPHDKYKTTIDKEYAAGKILQLEMDYRSEEFNTLLSLLNFLPQTKLPNHVKPSSSLLLDLYWYKRFFSNDYFYWAKKYTENVLKLLTDPTHSLFNIKCKAGLIDEKKIQKIYDSAKLDLQLCFYLSLDLRISNYCIYNNPYREWLKHHKIPRGDDCITTYYIDNYKIQLQNLDEFRIYTLLNTLPKDVLTNVLEPYIIHEITKHIIKTEIIEKKKEYNLKIKKTLEEHFRKFFQAQHYAEIAKTGIYLIEHLKLFRHITNVGYGYFYNTTLINPDNPYIKWTDSTTHTTFSLAQAYFSSEIFPIANTIMFNLREHTNYLNPEIPIIQCMLDMSYSAILYTTTFSAKSAAINIGFTASKCAITYCFGSDSLILSTVHATNAFVNLKNAPNNIIKAVEIVKTSYHIIHTALNLYGKTLAATKYIDHLIHDLYGKTLAVIKYIDHSINDLYTENANYEVFEENMKDLEICENLQSPLDNQLLGETNDMPTT